MAVRTTSTVATSPVTVAQDATTTAAAPVAASTSIPTSTSTAPVSTDPSMCAAGALRVSFDVQPDGGPTAQARTHVLIVVTDQSVSPCTVAGFATVEVVDGGAPMALGAVHVEPAPAPAAVVLASGQSAFAGMEWTSAPGCGVASSFRLVLPGQDGALPVGLVAPGDSELLLDVCATGVELGPFTSTSDQTLMFPDPVGAG